MYSELIDFYIYQKARKVIEEELGDIPVPLAEPEPEPEARYYKRCILCCRQMPKRSVMVCSQCHEALLKAGVRNLQRLFDLCFRAYKRYEAVKTHEEKRAASH